VTVPDDDDILEQLEAEFLRALIETMTAGLVARQSFDIDLVEEAERTGIPQWRFVSPEEEAGTAVQRAVKVFTRADEPPPST
jgi:hypothetical protein